MEIENGLKVTVHSQINKCFMRAVKNIKRQVEGKHVMIRQYIFLLKKNEYILR